MKTTAMITGTIALFVPAAAIAASTGNVDNSGIFVWIFLGFCALIVVAQIIPTLLLMFGVVKGVNKVTTEKEIEQAKKS